MPINKDALSRFRVIDSMLSDPMGSYTTMDILKRVNGICQLRQRTVSLRTIQMDIKAIEEQFEKNVIRISAGGRTIVRYEDQSQPIFYKQLTEDEEVILRESLKVLGQFEGLDTLQWLEVLRKRLNEKSDDSKLPLISFSKNERLKIAPQMLGRLFTAISRHQTIDVAYSKFGASSQSYRVFPYQLKQYNNRWYLIGCPTGNAEYPFDPYFIINLALDRIEDFSICEDIQYIEPALDLKDRFDEIVGVTYIKDSEIEEVIFAADTKAVPYLDSKPIHITQYKYEEKDQDDFRAKYPGLKDFTFYSIECRVNYELISQLASFQSQIIVVSPRSVVVKIKEEIARLANLYAISNC